MISEQQWIDEKRWTQAEEDAWLQAGRRDDQHDPVELEPHPVYILMAIAGYTLSALVVFGTLVLLGHHWLHWW